MDSSEPPVPEKCTEFHSGGELNIMKKSTAQAVIGFVFFSVVCLELIKADSDGVQFVNAEWKRPEKEQQGSHSCVARRLEDNSEEVTCKTEVLFRQKPPAEYVSKIKSIKNKLKQLESQFDDCRLENERKDRLIQLQINLTDTIHKLISESDIKALESSWNKLTAGADGRTTFGNNLVLWMLDNVPNMRERFVKFNAHQSDEALKNDAEFIKQVKLIVGGLQTLISNLNNPGQLQASIEHLADVHLHMKPSIGLEYFKPLQENIHSFIEKTLNVDHGDEAPKAWTNLLTAFNEVLTSYANYQIGLSDTDKVALESSWSRLTAGVNGKRNAGVRLVLWMFNNVPDMRERFTRFNAKQSDEALKTDAEFLKQVDVIIGGFETLINNLNDPTLLQDRLESLADAHLEKKPAIGVSYFGPLQKNIHLFIESALGVGSDSDEAKAWTHLIAALNKVIKDHAIHNLGLSDIDREALGSSWNQLTASAGGSRNAGTNLVLWMLQNVPNIRDRFTKFDARKPDDILRKDAEFVNQVNLITSGLESLLNNVNNPINLYEAIVRLADAHLNLKPRVGLEYFGPLQRYIHSYIEKALGVSADSAAARAWTNLLTVFNNVLKDRTFIRIVSNDDKKALQSSWNTLVNQAGGQQNAGIKLVLWMFDNVPNMRDRFSKFNAHSSDDALKADAEFLKQVNVIVGGLESLINNVDDADKLQAGVERLVDAHLHMSPSVGLEYFGPLQQNIGSYIQSALGVTADSAEARAWTHLLSAFNEFLADHTIQKIGLSVTDRKVLEFTWNQLISGPGGKEKAGIKLVLWMLENVPNMRDQFSKFDAHKSDEALSKDQEFVKQVNNIFGGLESILNNLNKPGQLQSALEHLADDHLDRKPRIGLEFFGPLQKYIHLYIESTLNVATGSEESKAWTNLFTALNKVIRDHAIERLGLSDKDRKALDSSWKKLRSGAGGRNKAAINLVFWMFEHVPNMREQFTKFDAHQPNAALKQNPEFLAQVGRILGGIESLLNNLDDPVALKAAIDRLADAHLSMSPRIGLGFFGPLQQNIHEYIEETLGVSADSDEAKGWTHLFAAFNRVLKERTVLKIVSDNEGAALKSSWKSLVDAAGDRQAAGTKLVLWMLNNVPNMRDQFSKFNAHQGDDVLKADAEFNKQVERIIGGLESLINNVDNAGQLQAAIDRLVDAHLHMKPSIGLEFFEPLQQNIHIYIESALGVAADSNEAQSWTHLLSAYNTVLREHSLEKIGLSDDDRKGLESSWKKLLEAAGDKKTAGTNLVLWLFDNVPKMRDRFTKFNAHQSDDALKANAEFNKQVDVIVSGLEALVSNVNNPAALQAGIERLVDTHLNMQPSIGLSYFGSVQQYIHLYIAKTLNIAADSEEAKSWTHLWAAFNKVLKEHSLEKIGITDSERKLLISSWKKLTAGGKQNFGVDLVLWMFENVPNMRDQFTKFDAHQSDSALRQDAGFLRQVSRIVGGLESLINSLNEPGKLQDSLEKLTDAHLHFVPSVGIEFFAPLKDKIHFFIEKALNVDSSSAEAQAWTDLIGAFNKVLVDHTIQHIGLSDTDRKALDSSWKRLTAGENGVQNAGINLVLWMFGNVPNMRDRFSKFNANQPDDALRNDPEFLKQVDVIIGGLKSFLDYVNNPVELQGNLDRVAEAHLSMDPIVGVEYFKVLAQNIHRFIESSLGVSADSDESQAWTNLLAAFNKVVRNRTVLRIVTDSDKAALVSSWDSLVKKAGDKRSAGVNLVLWMLNNVPNMRGTFKKFNANQPDAALRGDAEFLRQVDRIVGGLESLVRNANNPSRLLDALERLSDAHLHMKPSIGLEFFGPLAQNIHSYIESALNVAADSNEAKAWTHLLSAFNKIQEFNSIAKIGLSDTDKQALVSSWNTLISAGKESAGVNLVLWMLDNVPNMRDRFTKFNAHASDDALKANAEFLKQVNVIVGGLESLINSANSPGQLQANLERLVDAHLHMTPSVGLEYFGPLQQYIHLYIEKALGVSASSVESKAWTHLLGAFNKVLKEYSVQKIGLTDTDRKSVISSWKKLLARAGSRQNAGNNLVLWMFENVPHMRDRFTKFNAYQSDAALRNDPEFLRQVDLITTGLESLINNVDNPGQFQAALERLSAVHKNKTPSIGLEYFAPLQRYIHLYIEKSLNTYGDSDEARAWTHLFESFNEVLKKA
ncbi:hemoglobin type 1 [Biomphalaria pfeifferi]|uniref:Globin n=1 Tax=Biomphalaria pfeifferi TaxID=112525 RepID=A0AAD8AVP2_BIOPF|nr:hemoglobin type 1 [Biomphalaria pfeifferi]